MRYFKIKGKFYSLIDLVNYFCLLAILISIFVCCIASLVVDARNSKQELAAQAELAQLHSVEIIEEPELTEEEKILQFYLDTSSVFVPYPNISYYRGEFIGNKPTYYACVDKDKYEPEEFEEISKTLYDMYKEAGFDLEPRVLVSYSDNLERVLYTYIDGELDYKYTQKQEKYYDEKYWIGDK